MFVLSVIVPAVLIVRLFLNELVLTELQVPVPFNTIVLVPLAIFPAKSTVRFPPTKIELLFSVTALLLLINDKLFATVKLLVLVIVVAPLVPKDVTLFHIIPLVLRVVVVTFAPLPINKVLPVVTTVPAVYVNVLL